MSALTLIALLMAVFPDFAVAFFSSIFGDAVTREKIAAYYTILYVVSMVMVGRKSE
ncbi:MAG: hypothetical protein ABJ308_17940 [Halieaceae bacterium]